MNRLRLEVWRHLTAVHFVEIKATKSDNNLLVSAKKNNKVTTQDLVFCVFSQHEQTMTDNQLLDQ